MSRRARQPPDIIDEIRRLRKTEVLLIRVQHAANEDVEFDIADELAVI